MTLSTPSATSLHQLPGRRPVRRRWFHRTSRSRPTSVCYQHYGAMHYFPRGVDALRARVERVVEHAVLYRRDVMRHAQDVPSPPVTLAEPSARHARFALRSREPEWALHAEARIICGEALDEGERTPTKLTLDEVEELPGIVIRNASGDRERANLTVFLGCARRSGERAGVELAGGHGSPIPFGVRTFVRRRSRIARRRLADRSASSCAFVAVLPTDHTGNRRS